MGLSSAVPTRSITDTRAENVAMRDAAACRFLLSQLPEIP